MIIKLLVAAALVGSVSLAADHDPAQALNAVEAELRRLSPTPDALGLRRLRMFRQSAPDTVAICGQVSPTGAESAFIDFAAVVTRQEPEEKVSVQELYLADDPGNAARTMAITFLRCGNEERRIDMRAGVGNPSPPPATSRIPAVAGALSAQSTVTMRQGGNLRAGPTASSPVLRVIPRGTVARVFAEAPGGWYQIGDAAPWGWMHVSMLAGPPQ